jgi:hypothetical protein
MVVAILAFFVAGNKEKFKGGFNSCHIILIFYQV